MSSFLYQLNFSSPGEVSESWKANKNIVYCKLSKQNIYTDLMKISFFFFFFFNELLGWGEGGELDALMPCYNDMAVLSLKTWTCMNVKNSHPNSFCKFWEWEEHGLRSCSSCVLDHLKINIKPRGLCLRTNSTCVNRKPSFSTERAGAFPSTHAPSWTAGGSESSVIVLARRPVQYINSKFIRGLHLVELQSDWHL